MWPDANLSVIQQTACTGPNPSAQATTPAASLGQRRRPRNRFTARVIPAGRDQQNSSNTESL